MHPLPATPRPAAQATPALKALRILAARAAARIGRGEVSRRQAINDLRDHAGRLAIPPALALAAIDEAFRHASDFD